MQIQKSILIKIVNLTARNIHYPVKEWIHAAQNAFRDANDQYNNKDYIARGLDLRKVLRQ